MDANRFDAFTQLVADARGRRGLVKVLAGTALGGLVLAGASDADAKKKKKKKKKITLCHEGQTIKVGKKAKKAHLAHGDTLGECGSVPPPPPPPPDTCGNGVKDGNETDVDCGGSCGRCDIGKACTTRNDCKSALCVGGVCTSCVLPADCGLDTDGVNGCFCRDSLRYPGTKYCSTQVPGTNFPGIVCEKCAANEGCAATDGGVNTECNRLCGAT